MIKNNRKKAVAQAISTAVALGWVIMLESAQAATFVVNNLNDSGVGSLRDTINIANSNDVVEFLLGSHPSTIALTSGALAIAKNLTINGPGANLLTISSNNQFPVFDISAADVEFSGLAIAGNINAYNSSNLTFTNSTISGENVKIDNPTGKLTLINSTIKGNKSVDISSNALSLTGGSQVRDLSNTTNAGDLTISTGSLRIVDGAKINYEQTSNGSAGNIILKTDLLILRSGAILSTIPSGTNNSGLGGNITINIPNGFIIAPPNEPSAIAGGSNSSRAGGNITLTVSDVVLLTRVTEPSAIAGSILVGSLAWLMKRKQGAFGKAKV
ncbi:hypothetical protein LC605_22935 [Nostoc sp. CHAB 5836]|uniref:hypothetical protein n=1 Tax=Nostoc sp. CHAB 5836 TaxID=2780404 RepID=UPI001E3F1130|nr:hypothetical protein [Nostoc sp. CHAB 5836]MCC5617885.1 hypothetical protein [Nostoc sp. CHAB 5836]